MVHVRISHIYREDDRSTDFMAGLDNKCVLLLFITLREHQHRSLAWLG